MKMKIDQGCLFFFFPTAIHPSSITLHFVFLIRHEIELIGKEFVYRERSPQD